MRKLLYVYVYLAKRIACSVIYQIDKTFMVARDREHLSSYHSTLVSGILSDLQSANVQIACCICHTRVAA